MLPVYSTGDVGVPKPVLSQCYKIHRIMEYAKLKDPLQDH